MQNCAQEEVYPIHFRDNGFEVWKIVKSNSFG